MKFSVKTLTKCSPRTGLIDGIKRLPQLSLETPAALLHTKGGSIPHLTREVADLVSRGANGIQVPLVTTSNMFEPLSEYEGSLAEFVGLSEYLTYVTIQDPAEPTPQGHHLQNSVPIWTKSGKVYLNPDSYMDMIESFAPDLYVALCDGDTGRDSSKKRVGKAVERSLQLYRQCLERHRGSARLGGSALIAAVEGGYCLRARQRSVEGLLAAPDLALGFLIDGLHGNGPQAEQLTYAEVREVVEKTICLLPAERLRVMQGAWRPDVLLHLVSAGVDLFDTSLPHLLTERGAALTLHFRPPGPAPAPQHQHTHTYLIDCHDTRYSEDMSPLVAECECLTCRSYTRAYLHHLLTVQELLGPLLLNIHNLHHYLSFFKEIRRAVRDGTLEKLQHLISEQVEDHYQKSKEQKQILEDV